MTVTNNTTLAYILEKFPSPTEYFVLNEILELESFGVNIVILVLRKQKKYISIPELKNLKSPVIYLSKIYFYFPFIAFLFYPFSIFRSLFSVTWPFNFQRLKNTRNYCISLFFYNKLKSRNVGHIHAHFAFITVDIAYFLSGFLKTKHSFTAHSQDIYMNGMKLPMKIKNASFVITCTEYNKNFLNRLTNYNYNEKIFQVYHGLDQKKWEPTNKIVKKEKDKIHILSIARLVEKKGILYLLKAIKILSDKSEKNDCIIIGDGPLKHKLNRFIIKNKIQDYVKIIPFLTQEELKSYYVNSDVFVLPCIIDKNGDRDGLPNVILEAMCIGIPVISSNISAIPECIINNKTGILLGEKDEHAIAIAIIELTKKFNLYEKFIFEAQEQVKLKFDLNKCTFQLINIFKSNTQLAIHEKNN